jgi:hypothetical protein
MSRLGWNGRGIAPAMPGKNLETLAKKYYKELILLFVDGAGNHRSDEIPANIILHLLPPYSPELNLRKICGMKFVKRYSRTTLSNP